MNTKKILIVMFGATGDLAKSKLWSSFAALVDKGKIARPDIIGVAHRDRSQSEFKSIVDASSNSNWYQFIDYLNGDLNSGSQIYQDIAKNLASSKPDIVVFVMAVAPHLFTDIAAGIDVSGLRQTLHDQNISIRLLVEKPFGKNLESARTLDRQLCNRFASDEIYRIDHYLGKSMVQNLYTLRNANPWFEDGLHDKNIDQIVVKFLETNTPDERGSFYDQVGAWRDVGQNHMLQFLSAAIAPLCPTCDIPPARAEALQSLTTINSDNWFRAQYRNYHLIPGVNPDSTTETYFKIQLDSALPRWQNTNITLVGGKGIDEDRVEVVYRLKNHDDNYSELRFSTRPDESATIELWGQDDSHHDQLEKHSFAFSYLPDSTDAYERVFLSAIKGESQWFVSSQEVMAQWKLADVVHDQLSQCELQTYQPGTILD